MDAGAFVQENKRWLIGCAIGGVVWLIANSVIGTIYDPIAVQKSAKQLGAVTTEVYDRAALDAARQEGVQLQAERQRLERELAFVPSAKYSQWSGPADDYLFLAGRDLKRAVLQAASDRDVLVDDRDITWEVTGGVDQIKRVLFGLDLIDEIQQRLFAAHDLVREHDEFALALVSVLSMKLETQRSQRTVRRVRKGEVDVRDLLQQQRVLVQFQADEATMAAFFESCRQPNRTLVMDSLQVLQPERPGEPCTVKITLAGIAFLRGEQE